MRPLTELEKQRFLERIKPCREAPECWFYWHRGCEDRDREHFRIGQEIHRAYRVLWMIVTGKVPGRLVRRCATSHCIRPSHRYEAIKPREAVLRLADEAKKICQEAEAALLPEIC